MNDEETWLPVADTAGRYEVSNLGRLRQHYKSCTRVMAGCRNRHGYYVVSINGRQILRHVLIATTFYGPAAPGQVCRHLNGVAGDDRVENLRWGTPKEPEAPLLPRELDHGKARMPARCRVPPPRQRLGACRMTASRPPRARLLTVHQVADAFGVSPMTIYRLLHSGELPAFRIGRSFRIAPADADRYLRGANTWNLPPDGVA